MTVIDRFVQLFGDGHFVLCKGKKAINNQRYSADVAKQYADGGGQVGLWVPEGFIIIDVDSSDEAEILNKLTNTVKCKTKKGMHFYFKVDSSIERVQRVKAHTPIGLVVDTRVANKGYCIIPINDKDRTFIDGELEDLPFWLDPLKINSKSERYIVPNAKEGDGRNDSLLRQVMRLKSNGFDDDAIYKVACIINNHVFATPLDKKELDTILKSSNNYDPVPTDKSVFLLYNAKGGITGVNHLEVVNYLIKNYKMFILGDDDLYIYEGGVFINDAKMIRDVILNLIDCPKFQKQSVVMEIYRLLLDRKELVIDESYTNYDKRKINFLNGMFDVDQQRLVPHSPDYLSTIQIPFNYAENDLNIENIQLFDFFRRTKLKQDDIAMILKYLAYCMLPTNNLKCFMCLVGDSNTGKSTLINIITKILGIKNVSNLSIHQLSQRFYPSELKDKLLNANADNGAFALTSIENLKKITGNDRIMWERKGQTPYFFTPISRLLFSFNKLPQQVEERSDAFWQRIRILEMNNKLIITQNYYDDLVSDESIQAIIPILCRTLKNLHAIEPSENSIRLTNRLRYESDSITAFINSELDLTRNTKDFMTKDELYYAYCVYCNMNDLIVNNKKDLFNTLEEKGLKEVRRGEYRKYGYYGLKLRQVD